MKFFEEFRQFVQRGNVIDLAVGVIMGAAFTTIVNSLVNDVITPPIGYVIGGMDFSKLSFELPKKSIKVPDPQKPGELMDQALGPATIKYGNFIQMTLSFLITSFCVFMLVKAFNTFVRKQAAAPPPPALSPQEKLLTEIRDLLQQQVQKAA